MSSEALAALATEVNHSLENQHHARRFAGWLRSISDLKHWSWKSETKTDRERERVGERGSERERERARESEREREFRSLISNKQENEDKHSCSARWTQSNKTFSRTRVPNLELATLDEARTFLWGCDVKRCLRWFCVSSNSVPWAFGSQARLVSCAHWSLHRSSHTTSCIVAPLRTTHNHGGLGRLPVWRRPEEFLSLLKVLGSLGIVVSRD